MSKRTKFNLILIIVGLIIVIPIVLTWIFARLEINKSFGIPELLYYSFQILGTFAMSVAVIVAIFGQEVRNLLLVEKCSISLKNGGLAEHLGKSENSSSPEAQYYDCFATIKNTGTRELTDCQFLLQEVHYKKIGDSRYKKIIGFDHRTLYWNFYEEVTTHTLISGDSHTFPLFRIYPQNSCQTPDDEKYSKLRMRIFACNMEERYTEAGCWKIKYQIRTSENILKSFEIIVQWDGTWFNRINEMQDVVSVNYKEE